MINVLLKANHPVGELAELQRGVTLASLPIAGRSLLERTLEAIAVLDLDKVTVAVPEEADGAFRLVAGGERWGVKASVVPMRVDESLGVAISRHRWLSRKGLLVVSADRLRDFSLADALAALQAEAGSSSRGLICATSGLCWLPAPEDAEPPRTVDISSGEVLKLDSARAYHQAVLAVSRDEHKHLTLRGRQQAVGLRHGYMTRVHPRSLRTGTSFVGNHCRVHPSCRLDGTVVLEHGVRVGRMTRIENSIVLSETVVGEHLEIRNAIVAGNTLIRIDTGVVLRLSDRWLLFERGSGLFSEYFSAPVHRLAGMLLLILATPLMLPAVVHAIGLGERPFVTRRLLSNLEGVHGEETREFDAYSLTMGVSLLRRLPMLLAVAKGDLRLIGVAPLSRAEALESRVRGRIRHRAGMLGPTQLYLGLDAPLDARIASDDQVMKNGLTLFEALTLMFDFVCRLIIRDSKQERDRWAGEG